MEYAGDDSSIVLAFFIPSMELTCVCMHFHAKKGHITYKQAFLILVLLFGFNENELEMQRARSTTTFH